MEFGRSPGVAGPAESISQTQNTMSIAELRRDRHRLWHVGIPSGASPRQRATMCLGGRSRRNSVDLGYAHFGLRMLRVQNCSLRFQMLCLPQRVHTVLEIQSAWPTAKGGEPTALLQSPTPSCYSSRLPLQSDCPRVRVRSATSEAAKSLTATAPRCTAQQTHIPFS